MPALVDACSAYPFVSADAPSGFCTTRGLAGRAPRILTPRVARACALEEPKPRRSKPLTSLSSHRHASSTPSRLAAADTRLATYPGFTCSTRTTSDPPRKERTSDDPGRLPSCRETAPSFHLRSYPILRVILWRIPRNIRVPIRYRLPSPTASVSTGYSVFRNGDFVFARSCLDGSSCDSPRCMIEIRPTDFCFPSLCKYAHPYSSAPGSSSGLAPCVYLTGCAHQNRGIERFHDARIASWIAGFAGEYSSQLPRKPIWARMPKTTNSDTSVAPRALRAFGDFSRRCVPPGQPRSFPQCTP